jgi:competence protein ComEC
MSETLTPNASDFTFYPVAWLTVCFAIGIFLARVTDLSWAIFLVAGLLAVSLTVIFFQKKNAAIFLLPAFISLGGLMSEAEKLSVAPNRLKVLFASAVLESGRPYEITGRSEGKPEQAVGGSFLVLRVEKLVAKGVERDVSGSVRLFLTAADERIAGEYDQLGLGFGSRVRVACELVREEKFRNPGGIRATEILDRQGIDATGIVKSPLLMENLGGSDDSGPLGWVYDRRQNLIVEFKKRFSVATAGVLIASLLGNKYHLDKTTAESFREGGTFHILVISGLQITFIGGLAILLLRQFTRSRFWQFLLASVFLWTYTLAVGADVPVTRAAVMFTVWYFAYVVFRQATLLNTLAVSALALLSWTPSVLFDQSFHLTFICVLAIVASAVPLLDRLKKIGGWQPRAETPVPPNVPLWLKTCCEALYWSEKQWREQQRRTVWKCRLHKTTLAEKLEGRKLQKILRFAFETVVVSLVVQIWLMPLAILYFHRISWISIFLNIPVGVLMAVESLLAVAGVMLTQLNEILAAPFIWAAENLNWLILQVTVFFIGFEWSSLRLPHYSGPLQIVYLLYFIPVLSLTYFLLQWDPLDLKGERQQAKGKIMLSFAGLVLFATIVILHPFSAPHPDGKLRIDFLDVGQGDSILVTMPTGETLLVDGGGRANFNHMIVRRDGEEPELFEPDIQNIGETVVSNFLWEKGYDKVDFLLPTHADTDHLQGLTDVVGNFRINSAIVAATPLGDADFARFYEVLEKRKIPRVLVNRGDVLSFGQVRIEVLHPEVASKPEGNWDNNRSIVLRIVFGETAVLLTGDLEREGETELLQRPRLLRADIVKVAHHGSKTSSLDEFVRATGAKLAVIPVGKRSPFGHPDQKVVERWQHAGAKVMTTGENGTITVVSDGRSLQVKTFAGK